MMRCPADEGLIILDTTMQQQLGPAIFVTNGVDVGLIAPASSFQKMKEQRYV
jgi:hypothetical protein